MKKIMSFSKDTSKALKNNNWLMLEKLVTMPVALLVNVVIARALGVEDLGTYSYLMSLVFLVSPLTAMGLTALVTRELVNQPENQPTVMGASWLGRFLGSLVGLVILIGYGYFFESAAIQVWIVWLAIAQVFRSLVLIDFWFQSRVEAKYSALCRLIHLFVFSSAKIGLAYDGATLNEFVLVYALEIAAAGFIFLAFYRYRGGRLSTWRLDAKETFSLLKQSYWLLFSGFASVVYLKIDMVMLKQISGPTAAGIYAVASRLSEVWYFLPAALVASFFPMLLKAKQSDVTLYYRKLQRLNDGLFSLALIVVIGVLLFSDWVIALLYGDAFIEAASVLKIHIFAGIFIFMRALFSKWLIAEHILKYSLISQGAGAIVNVLANLLLIEKYGATGAAWATLFSYTVASYGVLWMFPKLRPMAKIMTRSLFTPFRYPIRWIRSLMKDKNNEN